MLELKELVSLHQSVCVSVNAWVHFLLLFHKSILIINKEGFGLLSAKTIHIIVCPGLLGSKCFNTHREAFRTIVQAVVKHPTVVHVNIHYGIQGTASCGKKVEWKRSRVV